MSTARSTSVSAAAQNAILITVPAAAAAAPRPHQAGGAGDIEATEPPSSSVIRAARSATPPGSPSSRTPTRIGARLRGRSISAADGASGESAAAAIAACAAAASAQSRVTNDAAPGSGCSRNAASTISPSVPSEPANSFPRS